MSAGMQSGLAIMEQLVDKVFKLAEGGEGVGHNVSTKTKIKNSLLGRKRTDEEKQAISNAMKGKKRPNSGKAISNAHKERYKNLYNLVSQCYVGGQYTREK